MPAQFLCEFCTKGFPTAEKVRQHIAKTSECRQKRLENLANLIKKNRTLRHPQPLSPTFSDEPPVTMDTTNDEPNERGMDFEEPAAFMSQNDPPEQEDPAAVRPRGVVMEEVVDEDNLSWVRQFPSEKMAGCTFGKAPTTFQAIRDDQVLKGGEVLGPFECEEEWELAKWLIKNVGHNQTDQFLKLPIIQNRAHPTFSTKDKFIKAIDALPGGIGWNMEGVTLKGDLVDDEGHELTEELEIWYRNPVDCIQELMGNPVFRDVMKYAPEKLYNDSEGKSERINEMWTAAWWWKLQELLPPGATIAPVILSSDKTKLSQFRGDKSAWPVYLTIGNISKDVRRQASSYATVLVGYLPVGKFDIFSDKMRPAARYQTFHYCMSILTASLVEAGSRGVEMTCSDGLVRWIWPILAAYVADYPEQCLIACCMENRCPICKVDPTARGEHRPCDRREMKESIEMLAKKALGRDDKEFKDDFKALGMRPVFPPFWIRLPYADIFQCFTPDLLHQLHKGVFKDHLVKWCTQIIGEDELDSRFKSMSSHPGLRHFKNGISTVSQWTGAEHKAMERVFVGLAAGAVDQRVMRAIQAVIDFIFYSSLQSHSSATLAALASALDDFHTYKEVFIELEARKADHFNIPKIHSMQHYVSLIRNFGSADGFNTESPERLHIDYAKNAYRASNKKDYTIQMTRWLQRQEAVDRFTMYLDWVKNGEIRAEGDLRIVGDIDVEADQDDVVDVPRPPVVDDEGDIRQAIATSAGSHQASTIRSKSYRVALHHPPLLRGVLASTIITDHHASRFLESVQSYLSLYQCPIIPQPFDGFDLFKRITVTLPKIAEASPNDLKNIVRASPPVKSVGRRAAEPAHLDFALVRTAERNDKTDGTSLQGLRVAHVKVLFKLPILFQVNTVHPLAYVEWYTPFGTVDRTTGMYTLRPSTRNRHIYGEIIEVDRIVRNCHMMPHFGRTKDTSWKMDNIFQKCKTFHPNPYSDTHMFCLFKVGKHIYGSSNDLSRRP